MGKGSVSNKEMEEHVKQVYATYDMQRRLFAAQRADEEDMKMLEDLEQSLKNKMGDKG